MGPNSYQIISSYPMDKIVFLKEMDATMDSYGMLNSTLAHGLADIPFCNAVISFDNWTTTYQAGTMRQARQTYSTQFDISSDSSNIKISAIFSDQRNQTAKIRIWGVYNSTSKAIAAPTRQLSSNRFVLNSSYNYFKLLKDGIADISSSTVTVNHNLGYRPIVQAWAQMAYYDSGWLYYNRPDSFSSTSMSGQALNITENSIVFTPTTVDKVKQFYYRIYVDAAE